MIRLALLASLSLILGVASLGCATDEGQTISLGSAVFGEWRLSELRGVEVDSLLLDGMSAPSLTIQEDGRVSGFAGVNTFSGSLDLAPLLQGDFPLSELATTRMAGTAEAMNLESRFLDAMSDAGAFSLQGNRLTLIGDEQPVLVFRRLN